MVCLRDESQRDISEQIKSLWDVDISPELVSKMADLKKIYTAVTEDEALENLMIFKERWGKHYPSCVKSRE